ncbi:MAG: patatin family protein [Acutalibacteraceae bacterium]|nr:patatin family protein [Clostridia bacterium]MEE3450654.1 patatin family protein [Acutalibacteraceae bacterium]
MKTGLVLEGGAMRATYTIGVLDVLMENNIKFDGIIGVSAGAVHGANYVSNQPGRGIRYYKKYASDKRFMSFSTLIKTGDIVGRDFCYYDIPWKLDIFDNDTFKSSPTEFYAVVCNVETGKSEYIRITDLKDPIQMEYLRASASMPLVSKMVEADGKKLLDGGMTDSIPLKAFQKMGYEKNVVVATRTDSYVKMEETPALSAIVYRKYPNFLQAIKERPKMYNDEKDYILSEEKKGNIFFIRPHEELKISRTDTSPEHLEAVYQIGRADAERIIDKLKDFLKDDKNENNDTSV